MRSASIARSAHSCALRQGWWRAFGLGSMVLVASIWLAACGGGSGSGNTPADCVEGTQGCSCHGDQSCTQPGTGQTLACRSGVCALLKCAAGTPGCPCNDGKCSDGVCVGGLCVAGDSVAPPSNAVCYSPCQAGLSLPDGKYVSCEQDGLMARCLDGKVCTQGSCVEPGANPPTCHAESECPDFQTCIQGRCYSNCQTSQDCSGDRVCFRHVCRKPCSSSVDVCPAESACVIRDGDTGHCMPIREAVTAPEKQMLGTFSLSADHLDFSNTTQSGTITLKNDAPVGMDFTIRKIEHVEYRDAGPARVTTTPLAWVSLGGDTPQRVAELTMFVEGKGGTRTITVGTATNPDLTRWDGRLEVANPKLGKRSVSLSYVTRQDGRWAGKMYYFANFGEQGLTPWVASREDVGALGRVRNAFVQRWGALRQGRITWDEFQAVVTSTRTGSWAWPSMKKLCAGTTACYPYSSPEGYGLFSDDLYAYPIPSAVSELPIAFNLATTASNPRLLGGKIVSSESLQYAGDPAIALTFDGDPAGCKAGVGSACLAVLAGMDARISIGGRYATTSTDSSCGLEAAGTYALEKTPWLVPGFTAGTEDDKSTGYRYRYECRDRALPFGLASDAWNRSLAQSNPIADGRPRFRRLELVDGALVNQRSLFILFRERFEESFLGPGDSDGFSAYGFMVLTRSPADLDATAYQGNVVDDTRAAPTGILGPTCTPELVNKVLGVSSVTSANASSLATALLDGFLPGSSAVQIAAGSTEQVHYLCHDTGLFDGGPNDRPGLDIRIPCPAGSGVTYFTNTRTRDQIAIEACQANGTCQETLDQWKLNRSHGLRLNPAWRCADAGKVYCDTDRLDLRAGKLFYAASNAGIDLPPLLTAIDGAFRYKTQFTSRTGKSVGFAPEICVPNSNAIPYCYDPAAIEEVRARVDCALSLYSTRRGDLDSTLQNRLKQFFTQSFGAVQRAELTTLGTPLTQEGFEKLNAELLIMQGDEAYTRAFASRFDLAGSRTISFEGSLFEPAGMNLAGGAGNEMYNLYLAAQYYQMVLDRFYALSPAVWQSIRGETSRNFVTKETVEGYFNRLIRASTQKARAWSEVAKRYQSFNRPDLARHALERAYAAAYLESVIFSRMMLRVVTVAAPADRDSISSRADLAALGYRAALLDMRDVWASIADQPTSFGFAPDYIPFPALDPSDVNAFTKLLATAKASLAQAEAKEVQALASTRAYDTDAAQFQAELIRIRQNFESQLAGVCGTFTGRDGLVHPAVRTYAHLDPMASLLGDPCGFAGNGKLNDAMGAVEQVALNMSETSLRYDDLFTSIQIEKDRVAAQCKKTVELADYRWTTAGKVNDLQSAIANSRNAKAILERARQDGQLIAQLTDCVVGQSMSCPNAAKALMVYAPFAVESDIAQVDIERTISSKEGEIADLQAASARWETLHQCDVAQIESDAVVKNRLLELQHLDLEALKNEYSLKLALAQVESLRNEASRLLAEQEELEEQTINVESARNDPNVRIYKNDAVILADDTFRAAVRDAYVATKAFEYYTSQSYAHLVDLFLVRMVSHGDYNLETYLADLEHAYRTFQQQYGNPDHRVEIVSLRDDVMGVPWTDATGRALTQAERIALFRERLLDPGFIDERGYRTIPFSTDLGRLSPLTRDHKIAAVEAEVIGADVGDTIARLYVRQRGTGLVYTVDDEKLYYRFPERTAIVNAFFNGVRTFGPEVYRSDRLRDRPYANTHWELVLNQLDERANQDINLQSLTDVRIYVYYTDFTRF